MSFKEIDHKSPAPAESASHSWAAGAAQDAYNPRPIKADYEGPVLPVGSQDLSPNTVDEFEQEESIARQALKFGMRGSRLGQSVDEGLMRGWYPED